MTVPVLKMTSHVVYRLVLPLLAGEDTLLMSLIRVEMIRWMKTVRRWKSLLMIPTDAKNIAEMELHLTMATRPTIDLLTRWWVSPRWVRI